MSIHNPQLEVGKSFSYLQLKFQFQKILVTMFFQSSSLCHLQASLFLSADSNFRKLES